MCKKAEKYSYSGSVYLHITLGENHLQVSCSLELKVSIEENMV